MNKPSKIVTRNSMNGQVIVIKHGEEGYYPAQDQSADIDECNAMIAEHEGVIIDAATIQAYELGSMFGWHIPAVANYV